MGNKFSICDIEHLKGYKIIDIKLDPSYIDTIDYENVITYSAKCTFCLYNIFTRQKKYIFSYYGDNLIQGNRSDKELSNILLNQVIDSIEVITYSNTWCKKTFCYKIITEDNINISLLTTSRFYLL